MATVPCSCGRTLVLRGLVSSQTFFQLFVSLLGLFPEQVSVVWKHIGEPWFLVAFDQLGCFLEDCLCVSLRVSRQIVALQQAGRCFVTAVVLLLRLICLAANDVFRLHGNDVTRLAPLFSHYMEVAHCLSLDYFTGFIVHRRRSKKLHIYLEQRRIFQSRPLPLRRPRHLLGFHRCTCNSRCFPLLRCK